MQATENTYVLISKLKSIATADTLIVTSIQKMSNIRDEEGGKNARDIELIGKSGWCLSWTRRIAPLLAICWQL